ncbi:hypothetical protein K474DRAFT_1667103 [Panus rudis PR-1116 ss-1]|nr:hypothetical protein K474DRAFT_1667103 [Panus rudis PR-1116 ss-1]
MTPQQAQTELISVTLDIASNAAMSVFVLSACVIGIMTLVSILNRGISYVEHYVNLCETRIALEKKRSPPQMTFTFDMRSPLQDGFSQNPWYSEFSREEKVLLFTNSIAPEIPLSIKPTMKAFVEAFRVQTQIVSTGAKYDKFPSLKPPSHSNEVRIFVHSYFLQQMNFRECVVTPSPNGLSLHASGNVITTTSSAVNFADITAILPSSSTRYLHPPSRNSLKKGKQCHVAVHFQRASYTLNIQLTSGYEEDIDRTHDSAYRSDDFRVVHWLNEDMLDTPKESHNVKVLSSTNVRHDGSSRKNFVVARATLDGPVIQEFLRHFRSKARNLHPAFHDAICLEITLLSSEMDVHNSHGNDSIVQKRPAARAAKLLLWIPLAFMRRDRAAHVKPNNFLTFRSVGIHASSPSLVQFRETAD